MDGRAKLPWRARRLSSSIPDLIGGDVDRPEPVRGYLPLLQGLGSHVYVLVSSQHQVDLQGFQPFSIEIIRTCFADTRAAPIEESPMGIYDIILGWILLHDLFYPGFLRVDGFRGACFGIQGNENGAIDFEPIGGVGSHGGAIVGMG